MQPSNIKKIYLIRIVKFIVFTLIFIAINSGICYALSPSANTSNEMWDYYFTHEEADTLFVGSSVTEMIDEFIIDEFTGRKCINMGTPSQYFASSKEVIDIGTRHRNVDTIILLYGFDALERDEDLTATLAVEKSYYDAKSIPEKLMGYIAVNSRFSFDGRNMADPQSVNKWMSWPVSCMDDFDQIKANLEKKKNISQLRKDQGLNGHFEDRNKYSRTDFPRARELDDETRMQIRQIKSIDVDEKSLVILGQIAEYCNANGISLIVALSPHKSGYAESFGQDYEKLDALTQNYVEKKGCMYINLDNNPFVKNLLTDEYFVDSEHVTGDGVDIASGTMSDILNLLTGKRG